MRDKGAQVFRERVVVIAGGGLAGFTEATAVVGDDAMPCIEKRGDLLLPRRSVQWIAVNEEHRIAGAVVFVIETNFGGVFLACCDVGHECFLSMLEIAGLRLAETLMRGVAR